MSQRKGAALVSVLMVLFGVVPVYAGADCSLDPVAAQFLQCNDPNPDLSLVRSMYYTTKVPLNFLRGYSVNTGDCAISLGVPQDSQGLNSVPDNFTGTLPSGIPFEFYWNEKSDGTAFESSSLPIAESQASPSGQITIMVTINKGNPTVGDFYQACGPYFETQLPSSGSAQLAAPQAVQSDAKVNNAVFKLMTSDPIQGFTAPVDSHHGDVR